MNRYQARRQPLSLEAVKRGALLWTAVGAAVLVGAAGLLSIGSWVRTTFLPMAPATASAYPTQAVEGEAVRFALAYETFDSAHPELRQAALAQFESGDPSLGWDGTGRQTATAALATSLIVTDDVAQVRVSVEVDGGRWIWLSVPVALGPQGQLAVAGPPALVSPPAAATVAAPPEPDQDMPLSAQLQSSVAAFMAAWAASNGTNLGYYAAPNVYFVGLGGADTFAGLDNLTVYVGGATERDATATVRWKDRASGATFQQTYRIQLRAAAGKWLVASLTPYP
ncbi:MAG TPA: conjugal transfer protein [Myxococcaceae bacterium]|nr:conjugal transfer protein [Myxococcaceae bacterium]